MVTLKNHLPCYLPYINIGGLIDALHIEVWRNTHNFKLITHQQATGAHFPHLSFFIPVLTL